MDPDKNEIYELIARSLTGHLNQEEANRLEAWKILAKENLNEYNDVVAIWIKSGSIRLPKPLDFEKTQQAILVRTGIRSGKKRLMAFAIQAAAVFILSVIFSGLYGYLSDHFASGPSSEILTEVKAAYGTQTKIALPDNSIVYLNSGSKLTFPQSFNKQKQRRVNLDGEGYFEVAKNRKKPFIVETRGFGIKVLGTKFNVDAYRNNSLVSVALVEGSVELQNSDQDRILRLSPNQVALFDANRSVFSKDEISNVDKYIAWINGRIVFFDDPIQTVVTKLSNWYNVDIVIADKKLESYKFTGTFIDEPVEQVLQILSLTSQMTFDVETAVKRSDNTITKRKIILRSKI